MNLSAVTLDSTRATLGGIALFQTIAAIVAMQKSKHTQLAKANAIGAAVCAIAASVYHRMSTSNGSTSQDLRHADWLITCPLMLWELYVLMDMDIKTHTWSFCISVVSIIVCIFLGRLAAESKGGKRLTLFGVATLVFVLMLVNIGLGVDWSRIQNIVPFAFLALWALYPLAFWEKSGALYNALDLVSKGVFGLYVGSIGM